MDGLTGTQKQAFDMPFGAPSGALTRAKFGACGDIAILARHGRRHALSPGQMPHRPRRLAMKALGVRHLLSLSAPGSWTLRAEVR